MAIRNRDKGTDRPSGEFQPSARPVLDDRELLARRAEQRRRRVRRRWILFGTLTPLVVMLLYFGTSYANYMLKPTSETFSERSAEWIRDDAPFGNFIIDTAEHYTASAPRRGGPGLKRLPSVGLSPARPRVKHTKHLTYRPPPIKPVFDTPLPGEGVWHRTGPSVDGGPPVLVTTYRPSTEYPSIVAYVLWIDHTRTDLAYYPGRYEPPSAVDRGPMMVPVDQRHRLLATFNRRLHARRHQQRFGGQRPHQRAADRRQRHARRLPRRNREHRQVDRRPERTGQRRLGAPKPHPDPLGRQAQPRTGHRPEQHPVGLHPGRRHLHSTHRRRHRRPRQRDVRRRVGGDGDLARPDPSAHWGGSRDGVRHQPRVAHDDHLLSHAKASGRGWSSPSPSSPPTAISPPTTATSWRFSPRCPGPSQSPSSSRRAEPSTRLRDVGARLF